jgi:NAD(P)-dependent dehydrogenase (short-subunit alcohol dehydrogenase family)
MARSLAGSVALITAGSAGLGAATARAFAHLQMRVVINYASNRDRADALVQDLYTISGLLSANNGSKEKQFLAIKADVSQRSEIARLVNLTVAEMGRLDVIFSNHGWTRLRNFTDIDDNVTDDDWDRCFNMNVKSHLYLMREAKTHLDATKGAFITTSSVAGVGAMGSSLVRNRCIRDG